MVSEGELIILGLQYPRESDPDPPPSANFLDREIAAERVME